MMFAPLPMQQQPGSSPPPPPPPQQQHQQYTPTRPSPLSPRRLTNTPSATPNIFAATSNNSTQFNIPSSPFTLPTPTKLPSISASAPPSPTPPQQQQQSHHQFARRQRSIQSSPNYAHRYANNISNPITKHLKSSASPSARRNVFLNRVKRDRDDGRFGDRGEQLVLMEHVAEEKRWGEVMRRRAEEMIRVVEEEEEDGYANGYDDVDAHALDEYLQEQASEMERLEYLNQQPQQQQPHHGVFDSGGPAGRGNGGMNISFSDEEEYDDLFMDLAGHDGGPDIPGSSGGFAHSQDMDMS